jgi:hypothetical protein
VVKGRNGNINNIIDVSAQAPDETESKTGTLLCLTDHRLMFTRSADSLVSQAAQYGTVIETDEDLAKEPPLLPPQLQISLLNAPMDACECPPQANCVVFMVAVFHVSGSCYYASPSARRFESLARGKEASNARLCNSTSLSQKVFHCAHVHQIKSMTN